MQIEIDVYADRINQVEIYAVRGEGNSRNIIFNVIEKDGTQLINSNADVINKMVNLSGYIPRLYIRKSDNNISYIEGIILDAENGKIAFTLTQQSVTTAGTAECNIILTSEEKDLRVVGIQLNVSSSLPCDDVLESTNEFTALQEALSTVSQYDNRINEVQSNIDAVSTNMNALSTRIQPIEYGGTGCNNISEAWNALSQATNWVDMELSSKWNTAMDSPLQYKKIGNIVYLDGIVKLLQEIDFEQSANNLIATLPEGFRPKNRIYILSPCSGKRFVRYIIWPAGPITLEWISDDTKFPADYWFEIHASFAI